MSQDNHILHAYKQTGELADTMSHHRWCSPDPSLFYLTLCSFVFNHTESLLTTSVSNQHLITLINQIPMDLGGPLYICSHWVQECVAMRESGKDRVSRCTNWLFFSFSVRCWSRSSRGVLPNFLINTIIFPEREEGNKSKLNIFSNLRLHRLALLSSLCVCVFWDMLHLWSAKQSNNICNVWNIIIIIIIIGWHAAITCI